MATYQKFNSTIEAAFEKVHNMGSDTLKVMLTLTAPVATNTQKTDLTEIASGDGYTTGGETVSISSSSQTSGTYSLVAASDITWTATAGTFADFRYVAFYNDTATNKELISFYDYGATISLGAGETFTVDYGATIFTAS